MNRQFSFGLAAIALVLSSLPAFTPLAARGLPDRFELGRDQSHEPCSAARDWSMTQGQIKAESDQAFVLSCRGVSAARLRGIVIPAATVATPTAQQQCGAEGTLAVPGLDIASARRCFDPTLGQEVVEIRTRGRDALIGTAAPSAVGPLVQLMQARISGKLPDVDGKAPSPAIDISGLAPLPATVDLATGPVEFNADTALQQGVQLMNSGQHTDASRVLNDALSRLDPATPPGTLIELMMTAALADSDMGQFEAAEAGFSGAAIQLAANQSDDRAAFLDDALRTYRALDALNQRKWAQALSILDARKESLFPLRDPIMLSLLNRGEHGAGKGLTLVTTRDRSYWLILDVEQRYARSVALLALRRFPESREALEGPNGATERFKMLEVVEGDATPNWLRSRLQLQLARIEARASNIDAALAGYDCAIQSMKALPQSTGCVVAASGFTGAAPASSVSLADVQLERAAVALEKKGFNAQAVLADYAQAVDTLIDSGRSTSGTQQPTLIGYFRLLLKQTQASPSDALNEQYFRAMQAVGDPAIAGDMARLANVVASDGTIGASIRDKADLERRITQLRYQIAALPDSDAGKAVLEKERVAAESELDTVKTQLSQNNRYMSQDDTPVTIAEMRAILRDGEAYLKLVQVRDSMFGIVIARDQVAIYETPVPTGDLATLSKIVLDSAHSTIAPDGARSIAAYNVEASYALFRTLTGPASASIARAKAVIYDPSGPVRQVPFGILVSDAESVARYKASRTADAFDYSGVNFMAAKSDLTMALSPRSFQLVRSKVAPSTAPQPFLGLGENAPSPRVSAEVASKPVIRGPSCSISYGSWAAIKDANPPISASQLTVAANALGVSGAPQITGAAFTDTGIQTDSDQGKLSAYQVLHFATHGLPETPIEADGCKAELPPSLITSMAMPAGRGPIESDGLLSFGKVAELNLNANLVVLSACETAASAGALENRATGAEGASGALDGLIRAFITANARAVMATFWRVPVSSQSDELMAQFYRTGRTASIGEALRAAQNDLIRQPQWSHPYYWGAYFVVGDSAKTMLTGAAQASVMSGGAPGGRSR